MIADAQAYLCTLGPFAAPKSSWLHCKKPRQTDEPFWKWAKDIKLRHQKEAWMHPFVLPPGVKLHMFHREQWMLKRRLAIRPECHIFKHIDGCHKLLPQANRKQWRDAVKKPHMSGYDLWMKEGLHHGNRILPPPDEPSNSGGFTPGPLNPGSRFPPPPDFVWYALQSVVITKTPVECWGTQYEILHTAWSPDHSFEVPHFLEFYFGSETPGFYYIWDSMDEHSRRPYTCIIPKHWRPVMECEFTCWDPYHKLYLQVSLHWPWHIRNQFRFPYERTRFL
ncbi:hypothetical protein ES703_66639 [subsurface metagenome]